MRCKSNHKAQHQLIEILPRNNELTRDTEYASKIIAANIELIVIVCAIEPSPSLELIDQYIVATENLHAAAMIVVNKTDLESIEVIKSIRQKYRGLPYPILETSVNDLTTIDQLTHKLKNKTCIFVGQSGVGKSSLTNKLISNINIETQSISENIQQGKHTTSVTSLYDLPQGGELIDSPGVRDFSQAKLNRDTIIIGFREIAKFGDDCKFQNCIHINEPDCAVKDALKKMELNADRYASYKKMIEKYDF